MKAPKTYRIRNWSQYNKSMEKRGNISLWFSECSIREWFSRKESKEVGRPFIYSDEAIKTLLLIKAVFKLPYQALVGFSKSLVKLLRLDIEIPSYSQISRRARFLGQEIRQLTSKKVVSIVIDSTGLKVYGEGEWKVRQHGIGKRRTWRKFHAAIDEASGEIVIGALTENSVADSDDDVKINGHSQGRIRMVNFSGALHFGQVQNVSLQNLEIFTTNPEDRIYLPITFLNDFELDGSILTFFSNTSFNTRANRFNILGDSKFSGRGATLTVTTNLEVNDNGNFEIGEFTQLSVNDFRVGGVESIFTLNNLSTLEFTKSPTANITGNGRFLINGQATFKGVGNEIATNANQDIVLGSGSRLIIDNAHLSVR